jgi:hypothetical protein
MIIWNILLLDWPSFWQNLTFSHCSNCDILVFHHSQTVEGSSLRNNHKTIILAQCTYFRQHMSSFCKAVDPTYRGEAFQCTPEVETAFRSLKEVLSTGPILATCNHERNSSLTPT